MRAVDFVDNLQISRSSLASPTVPIHRANTPGSNDHRFSAVSLNEPSDANSVMEMFRSVPFSQWNTKALAAWMEVVAGRKGREGGREGGSESEHE